MYIAQVSRNPIIFYKANIDLSGSICLKNSAASDIKDNWLTLNTIWYMYKCKE